MAEIGIGKHVESRPTGRWATPYRFISLVFVLLLFVFELHNVSHILRSFAASGTGEPLYSFLNVHFFVYAPFFLAFLVLLLIPESPATRVIQIALLLVYSAAGTYFVTPDQIGGDLVYLLGGVLVYKYGYLHRFPKIKIALLVGGMVAIRVAVMLSGRVEVGRVINQIAISTAGLPIVYWVFEADLIKSKQERARLEEWIATQAPFAEFSRQVGGIVHDFRSDLGVFTSFGAIAGDSDCGVSPEVTAAHDQALEKMSSRIDSILFVTKRRSFDDLETVELSEAIHSVIYAVRSDRRFRYHIEFDISGIEPELRVLTRPLPLLTILENTIRNSLESILTRVGEDSAVHGRLVVSALVSDGRVTITIMDNGVGFNIDCSGNILDCIESGYTTKDSTGGFGLSSIRHAARRLGATVMVKNMDPSGVKTTIDIPVREPET